MVSASGGSTTDAAFCVGASAGPDGAGPAGGAGGGVTAATDVLSMSGAALSPAIRPVLSGPASVLSSGMEVAACLGPQAPAATRHVTQQAIRARVSPHQRARRRPTEDVVVRAVRHIHGGTSIREICRTSNTTA